MLVQPGMVVRSVGGKTGVVIDDEFGVCSGNETLVVWEGTDFGLGSPTEDLEIVGPENAKADLKRCGAGRGEQCCIFLTVGMDGPECARHTGLRTTILVHARGMNAQRYPLEMYPNCQLTD